jgi:predicted nucleic acid-binding protein
MPSLTIKNISAELLERLKDSAELGRRSLNSEVIHRLDLSLGRSPVDLEAQLEELRALRERPRLPCPRPGRSRVIVVHVDVIAYLLIEGDHTKTSEALYRADSEWAAPLLWRSEWRAILRRYLRRGLLTLPGAIARTEAARRLVRGREFPVDDALVLELATGSPCSSRDCEYVALAETLGVSLATYDRDVLDAFPKRTVIPGAT